MMKFIVVVRLLKLTMILPNITPKYPVNTSKSHQKYTLPMLALCFWPAWDIVGSHTMLRVPSTGSRGCWRLSGALAAAAQATSTLLFLSAAYHGVSPIWNYVTLFRPGRERSAIHQSFHKSHCFLIRKTDSGGMCFFFLLLNKHF